MIKYRANIGFFRDKRTILSLSKKLKGHGIVKTAKVRLGCLGINTFVEKCDKEGKEIVEKHFRNWIPPEIHWEIDEALGE